MSLNSVTISNSADLEINLFSSKKHKPIQIQTIQHVKNKLIKETQEKSIRFLNEKLLEESKIDRIENVYLRIGNGYCNTHCDYCYVDFSRYDNKDSIKDYIEKNREKLTKRLNKIFDEFNFGKSVDFCFFPDGEPLLFQDLIIDAIKIFIERLGTDRIKELKILTNGSVPLTKEFQSLFSITKKFLFQISFDGLPEIEQNYRKINTKKILEFIEVLRKNHINYNVHAVITQDWYGFEDKVVSFYYKHFQDSLLLQFEPLRIPNWDYSRKNYYLKNSEFNEQILNKIFFYLSLIGMTRKISTVPFYSFCLMNKQMYYSLEDDLVYHCDVIKDNPSYRWISPFDQTELKPMVTGFIRGRFLGNNIFIKTNNTNLFLKKAEIVKKIYKTGKTVFRTCDTCELSGVCLSYLSCPVSFYEDYSKHSQPCSLKTRFERIFMSKMYTERAYPYLLKNSNNEYIIRGYNQELKLKQEIKVPGLTLFSSKKNFFFFKVTIPTEKILKRIETFAKENSNSLFISITYSEELYNYFKDLKNIYVPRSERDSLSYLQLIEQKNTNEFKIVSGNSFLGTINYNPEEQVLYLN